MTSLIEGPIETMSMNKKKHAINVFLLSFTPFRQSYSNGVRIIKFSFANFFIQTFSTLLLVGMYYKWFIIGNIESTEILGIAGYILGSGMLLNNAKKEENASNSGVSVTE